MHVNSSTYRLNDYKSFSGNITESSEEIINHCYQCGKCTNGCPVAFAMDIKPHLIIKMIQLGMEKKVLSSKTIWLCAACETCGTRCPNEIMLSDMFDALRQRAEKSHHKIGLKKASVFHKSFNASVKKHGRVYELGMINRFMIRSRSIFEKILDGSLFREAVLGIKMLKRGKLHIKAPRIRGRDEIKHIFKTSLKE